MAKKQQDEAFVVERDGPGEADEAPELEAQAAMLPNAQIEHVSIDSLMLDPANARKGDVAQIAASLMEFGQHRPVVVQRSSAKVIVGNHLVKAARSLGWTHVDALYVDDDDLKAIRRGIADNAVGDKAKWDEDALAAQLKALDLTDETMLPGFTDRDVAKLLEKLEPAAEIEAEYPIVARMSEKYSYVVIVATNDIDDNWLTTTFDLQEERDYANPKSIAVSRVLDVERARLLMDRR